MLDVGCGCGITTLAAADAVAPGTATGLDLSEPMLDLARQRAAVDPVKFMQADAQTHRFDPDAYDVIISRFGTMFFDDPLASVRQPRHGDAVDRPAVPGHLATPRDNDWLLIPGAALLRYGSAVSQQRHHARDVRPVRPRHGGRGAGGRWMERRHRRPDHVPCGSAPTRRTPPTIWPTPASRVPSSTPLTPPTATQRSQP